MAERADLMGAIRLPQDAFEENASTTVTTDILFFRKRASRTPYAGEPFLGLGETRDKNGETIHYNEFFLKHPEMMLGTMERSGRGMGRDVTGLIRPTGLTDMRQAVVEAAQHMAGLRGAYGEVSLDTGATAEARGRVEGRKAARPDVLAEGEPPKIDVPWQMQVVGDRVFQLRPDKQGKFQVEDLKYSLREADKVKRMFGLRKIAQQIMAEELGGGSDEALSALRQELGVNYVKFREKYGALNKRNNLSLIRSDPESSGVSFLENPQRETADGPVIWKPSDIFRQRTLVQPSAPGDIKTAKDAMLYSLRTYARLNLPQMAAWLGSPESSLVEQLGDLIFRDPQGGYMESEMYLSGNVRDKLRIAERAVKFDPQFRRNVEALQGVIPKDLAPHEIYRKLGSPWVAPDDIRDFIRSRFEGHRIPDWVWNNLKVSRLAPPVGTWIVEYPDELNHHVVAQSTWGTECRQGRRATM